MTGNVAIGVPADADAARAVLTCGRRLAQNLGIGWTAVLIRTHAEEDAIRDVFDLVLSSGGHLVCAEADDVAEGLIEVTRRQHARLLVIGASRRSRLLRRLVPGITERILRSARSFDVVIAGEGADI